MPEINSIHDLTLDDENPNGNATPRARAMIEQSLSRLGAGRGPCVDKNGKVIAGNKTIEIARELGIEIEAVHTNGTRLVVVVRDDLDLDTDAAARELSIADNRASEVGLDWAMQRLEEHKLKNAGIKTDYLFTADEIKAKLARAGDRLAAQMREKKPVVCPNCSHEFTP